MELGGMTSRHVGYMTILQQPAGRWRRGVTLAQGCSRDNRKLINHKSDICLQDLSDLPDRLFYIKSFDGKTESPADSTQTSLALYDVRMPTIFFNLMIVT